MNQLKIEIGDTVRIVDTSEYYGMGCTNPMCEGVVQEICSHIDVDWENNTSNTYYSHDLTLIKKGKTMQFTKSDLKTGMFVKQRDGDYAIVLDKALSTMRHYTSLSNIASGLNHTNFAPNDIMAVYTATSRDNLVCHLKGAGLTLIWERTEQTERTEQKTKRTERNEPNRTNKTNRTKKTNRTEQNISIIQNTKPTKPN